MDTIFMNSENSRTSEYHILELKLVDKLDLRRGQRVLLYQILVFTIHGETQKAHTRVMNLKYLLQHGVMNLNYQMDHIQYQIFKIILSIFLKNIVKVLMTHQSKSLQVKMKIGLHLKLKMDIFLNF